MYVQYTLVVVYGWRRAVGFVCGPTPVTAENSYITFQQTTAYDDGCSKLYGQHYNNLGLGCLLYLLMHKVNKKICFIILCFIYNKH